MINGNKNYSSNHNSVGTKPSKNGNNSTHPGSEVSGVEGSKHQWIDVFQIFVPGCEDGGYQAKKNGSGGREKVQSIFQWNKKGENNRNGSGQLKDSETYGDNYRMEVNTSGVENEQETVNFGNMKPLM